MQAIGMSNQQMKKMLRTEGFVYAGGIILLAGGLGSILGYLVYLYAESHSLMQIKVYQYPLIQVLLMILLVVIVTNSSVRIKKCSPQETAGCILLYSKPIK